ncbi:MAG: hypothetical protein BGO68_00260 [Candidatus Amoebophilus sp. 36-38]|nr:MAG: hypothetical protein BGO68_00260 [Candidatus Amoebophilus sp. 36-38]
MEAYQIDSSSPSAYLDTLKQLFQEHPFLATSAWRQVAICFENQQYTLVPIPLFQEKSSIDYLKLAVNIENESVKYCLHPDLNIAVVFGVDAAVATWLQKGYTQDHCHILHQASSLIEGTIGYANAKKMGVEPKVFVLAEMDHMHITVIEKSQLLYYNRFAYNSSDEFLQYILIVMYTLALNPNVHEVIVAGNVVKNSLVYKKMRNYIRYVSFSDIPPHLKFGWSFKKSFIINYFDLLNFYPASDYLSKLKFS